MWLNTWHQPRDSCELDLLDRMHPSEFIGFPFWASYPRLPVWACISVMKAIIAHPLRQTLGIGIPGLQAVNIINNSILGQDIIAILIIIPYIQVWPESGIISCIHDDIPRRHVHWKSEHDEPVNLSISRQTSYDSASRIIPSYTLLTTITEWLPHHIHNEQTKKSRIMNSHTTTAFIEHMKPMKTVNKQHIHHTLRTRM